MKINKITKLSILLSLLTTGSIHSTSSELKPNGVHTASTKSSLLDKEELEVKTNTGKDKHNNVLNLFKLFKKRKALHDRKEEIIYEKIALRSIKKAITHEIAVMVDKMEHYITKETQHLTKSPIYLMKKFNLNRRPLRSFAN